MLKIDCILIFVKVLKEIGVKFGFCSCSYSGTSSGKDEFGVFAWFLDSFRAVSGAKIPPLETNFTVYMPAGLSLRH